VRGSAGGNAMRVIEGIHNFVATGADGVGNHASAPLVVLVDNTPPETQIDAGPSGEILVGTATFTFSGSDNLTPAGNLVFSYRLDSGAWSAFAPDTDGHLAQSRRDQPHLISEGARDLACRQTQADGVHQPG